MNLSGKRVIITRPQSQAGEFADALRAAGAEPVLFPVIEIGPMEDTTPLDRALLKLKCYEWVVFTSVNGVEAVWKRFEALSLAGIPAGVQVAAIGPKTAQALIDQGATPQFTPPEYIAEAILPGLGDLRGHWVLLPRADLARPALARGICDAGGIAHEIAAYHTLPAKMDDQALESLREGVDIITFTSSSTVRSFVSQVRSAGLDPLNLNGRPLIACIGPITQATAVEEGIQVDLVASDYTTAGLIQALQNYDIPDLP